jgi:2-oxoglutarate/2-oxoacid ferredoxin oxidoreductase subunit beta
MSNCGGCTTTQITDVTGQKVKMSDYYSDNILTWCTGCGNYGILAALKRALVAEQIAPKDILLCFDIGCNGNGSDKLEGYRFHGLHGRVLPFAAGASLANPDIKVVASGGDGGTLSEGMNHLIQAVRNNYNITFLLHNNSNYALTTGQASATTRKGQFMSGSVGEVVLPPINPASLVLSLGGTFVARAFSGNVMKMTDIIRAGLKHPGFAFIEILQSCPTYNKATPHTWYQDKVYDVCDLKNYDCSNFIAAAKVAADMDNKLATGVLYSAYELSI